MRDIRNQIGVTLMELVVTLAILGVLAAIGTPVLMGNITAARNSQAHNTLRSIYLSQKNYFSDNNCYFVNSATGDKASLINQYLFYSATPDSGPIEAIAAGNKFQFYILADTGVPVNPSCPANTASGYVAYAESTSTGSKFSINQNNVTSGF